MQANSGTEALISVLFRLSDQRMRKHRFGNRIPNSCIVSRLMLWNNYPTRPWRTSLCVSHRYTDKVSFIYIAELKDNESTALLITENNQNILIFTVRSIAICLDAILSWILHWTSLSSLIRWFLGATYSPFMIDDITIFRAPSAFSCFSPHFASSSILIPRGTLTNATGRHFPCGFCFREAPVSIETLRAMETTIKFTISYLRDLSLSCASCLCLYGWWWKFFKIAVLYCSWETLRTNLTSLVVKYCIQYRGFTKKEKKNRQYSSVYMKWLN